MEQELSDRHREQYSSALRSYNAMETTKRRHFDYITMIEGKKEKFNLCASKIETAQLEALLRDHHEEVQIFKSRCDQLKSTNAAAHIALFEYIKQLNSALGPLGETLGH